MNWNEYNKINNNEEKRIDNNFQKVIYFLLFLVVVLYIFTASKQQKETIEVDGYIYTIEDPIYKALKERGY